MKKLFIAVVLGLFGFSSCTDGEGTGNLVLEFNAKFENQPFELNQVYMLDGDSVEFTILKYYISEVTTSDKDGNLLEPLSNIELIDFKDGSNTRTFEMQEGAYKNLYFGVGVKEDLNGMDPSVYDEDHPLSLANSNYWMMSNSYVFFKLEGMHTKNGLVTPIAYHLGTDALYRTTSNENRPYTIHSDLTTTMVVEVAVDEIFNSLSLPADNDTHTGNNFPLAVTMTDNVVSSIAIY